MGQVDDGGGGGGDGVCVCVCVFDLIWAETGRAFTCVGGKKGAGLWRALFRRAVPCPLLSGSKASQIALSHFQVAQLLFGRSPGRHCDCQSCLLESH